MYKTGRADRSGGTRAASFVDATGERWPVVLSRPAMAAVKAATGLDLAAAMHDGAVFAEMFYTDPTTIGGALAVACRELIDRRGLTADQFAGRIDGAALEAGLRALLLAAGIASGWPEIVGLVDRSAARLAAGPID